MLRVFKFGGALMKNATGIQKVVSLIEEYSCNPLVVVVSAIGKTTNALESLIQLANHSDITQLQQDFYQLKQQHLLLAEALFPNGNQPLVQLLDDFFYELWSALNTRFEDPYQQYDAIIRYGEVFSSLLVEHTALSKQLALKKIDAFEFITTDSNYTHANIDWELTRTSLNKHVKPILQKNTTVLTQGFVGASRQGNYTTLGREGSDFTAAIIANLLNAGEVTIWKDVPGVMNADPNKFPDCIKFDSLNYHEAIELAFYGATVIHPKTIQPLKELEIPLFVRSFYHPEEKPTCISGANSLTTPPPSIIVKDHQVLFSINSQDLSFMAEGNLTRVFAAFSENKIHINLMQHSAVSFSVCFDFQEDKLQRIIKVLEKEFTIRYNKGLQLFTIRHYTPEIIERIIGKNDIFLEQRSRTTFQILLKQPSK